MLKVPNCDSLDPNHIHDASFPAFPPVYVF
jgi:hypothetical protein